MNPHKGNCCPDADKPTDGQYAIESQASMFLSSDAVGPAVFGFDL